MIKKDVITVYQPHSSGNIIYNLSDVINLKACRKHKFNDVTVDSILHERLTTVFIDENATIPREWIKKSFDNHKIKLTTKLEKADFIVVNPETLYNSFYTHFRYLQVSFDSVKDYLPIKTLSNSFSTPYQYSSIFLCTTAYGYNLKHNKFLNPDVSHTEIYLDVLIPEKKDSFYSILEKPKLNIHKLLNFVQKDFNVLTEKDIDSLESMIHSNDMSNVNLVMNLLANCNYEKSIIVLFYFFKKHYFAFYKSTIKNSVTFKALLYYLDEPNLNNPLGFKIMIELLYKYDIITPENLDLLNKLIIKPSLRLMIDESILTEIITPDNYYLNNNMIIEKLGKPYLLK